MVLCFGDVSPPCRAVFEEKLIDSRLGRTQSRVSLCITSADPDMHHNQPSGQCND